MDAVIGRKEDVAIQVGQILRIGAAGGIDVGNHGGGAGCAVTFPDFISVYAIVGREKQQTLRIHTSVWVRAGLTGIDILHERGCRDQSRLERFDAQSRFANVPSLW